MIGCGNQTYIYLDRLRSPDSLELTFLQDAQKCRLARLGQITDLIEETAKISAVSSPGALDEFGAAITTTLMMTAFPNFDLRNELLNPTLRFECSTRV
jgi:hypothetical protein